MGKILTFLILLLFVTLSVQTQTPAKPTAEQAELARLNNEMQQAYRGKKFDETISIGQRVLELSAKVNGEDSRDAADAYFYTGASYGDKRKHAQAVDNFQRSLNIFQKKYPGQKAEILDLYNQLGLSNYFRGENRKAEKWLVDAVKLSEELYGAEGKETLEYVGNLSTIYRNLVDNVQAEIYMRRARTIAAKVYGADSAEYEKYEDAYTCFVNTTEDEKLARVMKERWAENARAKEKSGQLVNGKMRSQAKPIYPPNLPEKFPASIVVKVEINESGDVIRARAICGSRAFWQVSEDAALLTKFTPTTLDGKPIKVTGLIVYNFNSGLLKTGLINLW